MRLREKHSELKELIAKLNEKGRQENAPVFMALAGKLNRPRRQTREVNLFTLEKHAGKGLVIVPGPVLGSGNLTKPVQVAALKFSRIAEEKIKKAGGRCIPLSKFAEEKGASSAQILG